MTSPIIESKLINLVEDDPKAPFPFAVASGAYDSYPLVLPPLTFAPNPYY